MAACSVLTSRSRSTDGLDRRFFLQAMEGKLFTICFRARCDIGEWSACAFCMAVYCRLTCQRQSQGRSHNELSCGLREVDAVRFLSVVRQTPHAAYFIDSQRRRSHDTRGCRYDHTDFESGRNR